MHVKVPRPPVDPEPGSHAIATAETTAATSAPPTPQWAFYAVTVSFLNLNSLDFNKKFSNSGCTMRAETLGDPHGSLCSRCWSAGWRLAGSTVADDVA